MSNASKTIGDRIKHMMNEHGVYDFEIMFGTDAKHSVGYGSEGFFVILRWEGESDTLAIVMDVYKACRASGVELHVIAEHKMKFKGVSTCA